LSFLDDLDKKSQEETTYSDLPTALQVINDVLDKYKCFNAKQISEWSHQDTPWKCAENI
jgi:uncharacterized phage-associated protein